MSRKVITLDTDILKENELTARENHELFNRSRILAVNLLSSPGSGKTTLLVNASKMLRKKHKVAVTVGDLQTDADARKIKNTGVPAVQINTGTACHLDARAVKNALISLPLDSINMLFIENVGNLVCPAAFNLGEHLKIVLLGVTEGEEKPLKYPPIFQAADCVCINKIDLLPYVDFNIERCKKNLHQICPRAALFQFSCKTGEGLNLLFDWLSQRWTTLYGE